MGGSVDLVMYVESASRWMRLYGMRNKSEAVRCVRRFVTDIRNMGPPYGQRGRILLAAATWRFATLRVSVASTRPR